MIEVKLETIQVSLVSSHRVVVLKALEEERYLPIWIGTCEAEAIAVRLEGVEIPRPLTHDLLVEILELLGADLLHVTINALVDGTFYAQLVVETEREELTIDARPSDALALAVRVGAPIYVAEAVMDEAAISPEADLLELEVREQELGVFKDFLDTLDLSSLDAGA